jgi:serine/threonine-protein kinase
MHPSTDPLLGVLLPEGYRIFQLLKSGGTSRIYLGVADRSSGPEPLGAPSHARVALKILRPDIARSPDILAAFELEASIAARIRHPNVVRVLARGALPGGLPYLVTELLHGLDLADTLARARRLAPRRAVQIARSIASGLDAAHREGIVHRDLKPENVFLVHAPDGREIVKLLDFGASGSLGALGTPGYRAPEIARGGEGSVASDIYALGVVLFEMLTGELPSDAASPGDPSSSTTSVPPLLGVRASAGLELPASLDAALTRALAADPLDRFASMSELDQALEVVLGHLAAMDGGVRSPKCSASVS